MGLRALIGSLKGMARGGSEPLRRSESWGAGQSATLVTLLLFHKRSDLTKGQTQGTFVLRNYPSESRWKVCGGALSEEDSPLGRGASPNRKNQIGFGRTSDFFGRPWVGHR